RDADDLRRMDRAGDRLIQPDVLGERRNPEPRRLAVVADVAAAALVAEDHRVGTASVEQAERHAGVPRMVDAPLPLDEYDVGFSRTFHGDALRGAADEVGHNRVDRNAPPLDHDAGLAS